jgi:ubiquinone/menaquinone biosynthesis C-methylase UbiE
MTFEKIIKKASNANHRRNRYARIKAEGEKSKVFKIVLQNKIKPKKILEIGSSTGFVLENFRIKYNSKCYGIDTSKSAISEGKKLFKKINLTHGMFENSKLKNFKYDIIICGFFLFTLPPSKILKLFSEIDSSLNDGGYVVIKDFYNKSNSFKIKDYRHEKKLKVYRWDYKKIFLSLPYYQKIDIIKYYEPHKRTNEYLEVSLMKKINLF